MQYYNGNNASPLERILASFHQYQEQAPERVLPVVYAAQSGDNDLSIFSFHPNFIAFFCQRYVSTNLQRGLLIAANVLWNYWSPESRVNQYDNAPDGLSLQIQPNADQSPVAGQIFDCVTFRADCCMLRDGVTKMPQSTR